jgi:hypothetical protein
MDSTEIRSVVRTTLAVIEQITTRTRTPADDALVRILKGNLDKLAAAVESLSREPEQPPAPERVKAALEAVGIHT